MNGPPLSPTAQPLPRPLPLVVAVLAAGEGRRLGQTKPVLPLGHETLVERAVGTALAAHPARVLVVLGHAAEKVEPLVPHHPRVTVLVNPRYRHGQGGSLRLAAATARRAEPGAALAVLLVDMPLVTAAHLEGVYAALRASAAQAARAVHRPTRTPGHPVAFAPGVLPDLAALGDDDEAPRRYLRGLARVEPIPFDDDAVIFDIDTLEDYHEACRRLGVSAPDHP